VSVLFPLRTLLLEHFHRLGGEPSYVLIPPVASYVPLRVVVKEVLIGFFGAKSPLCPVQVFTAVKIDVKDRWIFCSISSPVEDNVKSDVLAFHQLCYPSSYTFCLTSCRYRRSGSKADIEIDATLLILYHQLGDLTAASYRGDSHRRGCLTSWATISPGISRRGHPSCSPSGSLALLGEATFDPVDP
jgi:hypothetical protein